MRLLGYGEDALTLWALQNRLGEIMENLTDSQSNVQEVFFRPSFGRRSRSRTAMPGPQFGELDAIIVSSRAVYLVEAKWTGSGELSEPTAVLREEQLRRHRVFREYLSRWTQRPYGSWAEFVAAIPQLRWLTTDGADAVFATAPQPSRLAKNLEFVLRSCAGGGPRVVDVLLAVHPQGERRGVIAPPGFTCVEVIGPPIDGNFVILGAA